MVLPVKPFEASLGSELTVTWWVAEHPLSSKYVILAVPEITPVTTPLLSTDATPVASDVQGSEEAAVPLPLNGIVDPTQTLVRPVIVGNAFTVITVLAEHPLSSV